MRYIKHHLESITGVEIYPLFSLMVFFLFFMGLLLYVSRLKGKHIEYMQGQPLDNQQHDPLGFDSNSERK